MRKVAVLLSVIATLAGADAGYLGTLAQGPSPAVPSDGGTSVRMVSEDVFIRLETCSTAVVSAAFLFDTGQPESVLMCYPVEVRTVFHQFYDAVVTEGEASYLPGSGVRIWVDGDPVEPFMLVQCGSWEDDAEAEDYLRENYGWSGPDPTGGGTYLVERPPFSDSTAYEYIISRADVLLVCWEVDFAPGEARLVEIEDVVRPTADYSGRLHRIAYPLVTGASWNGPIRTGRISVTGSPGFDWEDLVWWTGVLMPPPVETDRFSPDPLPGLQASSLLSPLMEGDPSRAIIWEFEDFEPAAGNRDSYTYYPDTGDIGGLVFSDMIEGAGPWSPWESSFVYLYMGPALPGAFSCICSGALALCETPGGAASAVAMPGEYLSVLDRSGDWLRVECESSDAGARGWLEMHRVGGSGLVEPTVIPLPGSYWEP